MLAANGQPIPDDYLSLHEAADKASSTPNVLRKHRVKEWKRQGLARTDSNGHWWVSPKVLESIKPVKHRQKSVASCQLPVASTDPASPEAALRSLVSAAEAHALMGDSPGMPAESEQHAAAAISSMIAMYPIPWALVQRMARLGFKHAQTLVTK